MKKKAITRLVGNIFSLFDRDTVKEERPRGKGWSQRLMMMALLSGFTVGQRNYFTKIFRTLPL